MDKQEAIALLEEAVAHHDYEKGAQLVETFERVVGIYPVGWHPTEDGFIWQGFSIRMTFDMFAMNPYLATDVIAYESKRRWFRTEHREVRQVKRILGPRDMLKLLEHYEPYRNNNG